MELILKQGKERSLLRRHPWVYDTAVHKVVGHPAAGDTVAVKNKDGRFLAWAAYSPKSTIRARVWSFREEDVIDERWLETRLRYAVEARRALHARTSAIRLVFGEADGLPGLIVDQYGPYLVTQFQSAGVERFRGVIGEILMKLTGARGVYDRSDAATRQREGLEIRSECLCGEEPPEEIEVVEDGVRYGVNVRVGHKTGFYLDQRDARAAVGALAKDADVLNCFSYTGGFGLAACAGGAKSVTHLDVSAGALALARQNTALNPSATVCDFVEADVFRQLRLYRDQGRSFDLIVLDPPKFADTKAGLMRATRGYKDINLLAMKLLRPNGLLATFSCSGAMTPDLFDKVCAEAAFDAKRAFQIVARTRQAAGDHPVGLSFPEGLYLKGLLLRAIG